jgi:hypothetical protein
MNHRGTEFVALILATAKLHEETTRADECFNNAVVCHRSLD